jgi:hypothetical protein
LVLVQVKVTEVLKALAVIVTQTLQRRSVFVTTGATSTCAASSSRLGMIVDSKAVLFHPLLEHFVFRLVLGNKHYLFEFAAVSSKDAA